MVSFEDHIFAWWNIWISLIQTYPFNVNGKAIVWDTLVGFVFLFIFPIQVF